MPLEFMLTTWDEIIRKIYQLGKMILKSGYQPDVLISILRGGAIPTAILSDILGVHSIYSLRIKLYKGVGEVGEKPEIIQEIPISLDNKRVLLIDDVSDTGKTLKEAVRYVEKKKAKDVRVATIHLKPWSSFIPHYYVETTSKWIIYPWEYHEFINEMKEKLNKNVFSNDEAKRIKVTIEDVEKVLKKLYD